MARQTEDPMVNREREYMHNFIRAAELERAIRLYLIEERETDPKNEGEEILLVFTSMEIDFDGLTTGFFNKTLADMRRAGVIEIRGTSVRISNLAFVLHQKMQERAAQKASAKVGE